MTQERKTELRELLFQLERKIKPLEWDASRKQINEYKRKTLGTLRTQFDGLQQELHGLENQS